MGSEMCIRDRARAGQISKELNSQDVANILWAMTTMGRETGERIMGLLEARVGEISKEFNFQAISLTLWAFGRLGCIPGVEMLGHLNRLSQDPATHFTEEQAACCMWATAVCHMTLPTFFVTRAGSISSWGDKSILSICDAARMFPPIDNHQTGALMNKTIPLAIRERCGISPQGGIPKSTLYLPYFACGHPLRKNIWLRK